ncbi:hypothetical protein F4782DRAFT_532523 [Xylaria castorea]|nr:hypothetical protein F4782DRAFT_532523 [Xylaria castorea]
MWPVGARLLTAQATTGLFCITGLRSWNEEVIEEMVKDLSPLWGDLNTSITDTNNDMLDRIDVLFDSASETLGMFEVRISDVIGSSQIAAWMAHLTPP